MSEAKRLEFLRNLTEQDRAKLKYEWGFWARPDQLEPPGPWDTWVILCGRGWGKTRTGAEWVRHVKNSCGRIALVGQTAADVRDVIVEGESGILANSPPWDKPKYIPSKRELRWNNGAIAKTYSGDEPDQLRGPQHDAAYVDELAKFEYPEDTWSNLQFGLRLGKWPRALITTTPRPIPIIKNIIRDPGTVVTRGRTMDNKANLASQFIKAVHLKYEGTRLGRQELDGAILDDLVGGLWPREVIDQARWKGPLPPLSAFQRIGVGVDPSGYDGETGDSQGIVVAGLLQDGYPVDGVSIPGAPCYVVLHDASLRESPEMWGAKVCEAYRTWEADFVIAEKNYGGAMVRSVIQQSDPNVPVRMVTATRGKVIRAEPISALYAQGRVKHARCFATLEDQMALMSTQKYEGEGSPDRLDALVWVLTDLSNARATPTLEVI